MEALIALVISFTVTAQSVASGPTEARPLLALHKQDGKVWVSEIAKVGRDSEGAGQSFAPGYAIDRVGKVPSGVRAALFVHGTGFVRIQAFRYRALTP